MRLCEKCGYYHLNEVCDLCGLNKRIEIPSTDIDPGFFRFTCVDCGAWVPHKRIKSDRCDECYKKKESNKNSNPSTIKRESYVVVSEYGDICTHTLRPTQDECEAAAISVWGKMWWEGMKRNGAVIKPCVISV